MARRRRRFRPIYRTQYLQPQVIVVPQQRAGLNGTALLVFAAVALALLLSRK